MTEPGPIGRRSRKKGGGGSAQLRFTLAALSVVLAASAPAAHANPRDHSSWDRRTLPRQERWERWHGYGLRTLRPGYYAPPPVFYPPSHRLFMQPPVYVPPGAGPVVPFR